MRFRVFAFLFFPILSYATAGYFEPWGKDADLVSAPLPQTAVEPTPNYSFAVRVAQQIIFFHQNIISPVDGPRSHFRPSSSSYMMQSMQKHGFLMGFLMGCDRLMRENSDPRVYRTIET